MATTSATIDNLRIEGQSLAFTLSVVGDAGGYADVMTIVYDAAGGERANKEHGRLDAGQSWDAYLDLPAATLDDGDYGAWVFAFAVTADDKSGDSAQQGISFLVARNYIYPSNERPDTPTFSEPPTLSPLRLEGTWIVFDMKNNEEYDVSVVHELSIGIKDSGDAQWFQGEELLRASATHQGHYLLPDNLVDGRYLAMVAVRKEGSDLSAAEVTEIQVDGTVLTLMPAT